MDSHTATTAPISEDVLGQFPRPPGTVYLRTTGEGLLPLVAREAVAAHLDDLVDGRVDKDGLFALAERVRGMFARLIHAAPEEIAITKNVSDGLNTLAAAFPWRPGDNVVVCMGIEHPANMYPWLNLRERVGVEVRAVAPINGHIEAEPMIAAIDDRTLVVTTSVVSSSPGLRTDIEAIGRACRERGVFLLADGAQSAGILDTDVEKMCIDGMAVSTHKGLLGLYGFGFLYCRQVWAERLRPVALSRFSVVPGPGGHEAAGDTDQHRLMPGARRFEVGNYTFPGVVAADASLRLLLSVGTTAIEAHVVGLVRRLAGELQELGLPVAGGAPGPHTASILCVGDLSAGGHYTADDAKMTSLYEHLAGNGILMSIRGGMPRMAFQLYNTEEDVDRIIELARDFA